MDRAIHSRCRIEAMTEVRFFLILFPIKPYVRRNIEKNRKSSQYGSYLSGWRNADE